MDIKKCMRSDRNPKGAFYSSKLSGYLLKIPSFKKTSRRVRIRLRESRMMFYTRFFYHAGDGSYSLKEEAGR